jgi:hypothetical protein
MMEKVSAQQSTAASPEPLALPLLGRVERALEENGTLVVVVAAFALVMLLALRHGLVVDGWMALVSGREIVQHGLPAHDLLTVWSHGRRWVDQQWLAQLAFYGLVRGGGLKLALFVHAALGLGALAAAAILARRLGGSARSTTWVCLPVLIAYYPEAAVLRPQSFGYPLFVAVLWLLIMDGRAPSRRVFLVFPLIALWGNLHGSALLGAGLVALAGLVGLGKGVLARPRRVSRRSLLLLLGPWPCLLVSPYALHLPAYYEKILVGGNFSHFVTEWAPTTLTPETAPVYLIVIAGMWLIGRAGERASLFEKLAFLATSVLAFDAVRNTAWLGLTALVVLPKLVDAIRRPAVEPRRLNRLVAVVMVAAVVVACAGIAAKPPSWFTSGFPGAAADSAAASAGAQGKVFAMSPYADWVLWTRPELRGRVAFDARFELFTSTQVSTLADFQARVGDWKRAISGYDVIVLGARDDAKLRDALVGSGVARVAHADSDVVVLRRVR